MKQIRHVLAKELHYGSPALPQCHGRLLAPTIVQNLAEALAWTY